MPYRYIYIGLGCLAIAVVALGIVLAPQGESVALPDPIEEVRPRPNDLVLQQTAIEVDLETGYVAEIWVDGFRVPDSEVDYVEATGVHRWAPTPGGLYLNEWTPGEHVVLIRWDTLTGPSDVGEFQWTFRVQ